MLAVEYGRNSVYGPARCPVTTKTKRDIGRFLRNCRLPRELGYEE